MVGIGQPLLNSVADEAAGRPHGAARTGGGPDP